MTERPQSDPPTDNLAALGDAERDAALCRCEMERGPQAKYLRLKMGNR